MSTPLACPNCAGELRGTIRYVATRIFFANEVNHLSLHHESDNNGWDEVPWSDGSECPYTNCQNDDCEYTHNYDPQRNKQLLDDTANLVFKFDTDYEWEDHNEQYTEIVEVKCDNCSWTRTYDESDVRPRVADLT